MKKSRATLGSRWGAVLVAAGSAVGLGNIWRFPYIAGENGGGIFFLIYIGCILLLGLPILLAEFSIGRHTHKNAVGSFREISRRWSFIGYLSVLSPFLILGFYFVVAGWTLEYFVEALSGHIANYTDPSVNTQLFSDFLNDPVRPLFFTVLFVLLTHAIIALGVQKGIERSAKLLMPMLFGVLIVLALRAVTMENGVEGLKFFFRPDFSKVTAATFLNAMGQAFFSLSIGLGCMITYASYFKPETSLPRTAGNVILLDTLVAMLASIVIFPAVFSVGIEPTAGPALVFETLPAIFNTMNFSTFWSSIFFLLLAVAALTSTISLHEVLTVYVSEEWHLSRRSAAWLTTFSVALLAAGASLSVGPWPGFRIFGKSFFDALDFVTANILLPAGGFFISLFAGWIMERKALRDELTNRGSLRMPLFKGIVVLLKYICPLLLLLIFLYNLGLFRL